MFSGNFCCIKVWVHAVQRRSNARISSYPVAKPKIFSTSPHPQKSQTTSKSQLQKYLTTVIFLWIDIQNRPEEIGLKKKKKKFCCPEFHVTSGCCIRFWYEMCFSELEFALNYSWTMNSFKKNNCLLITRINAVFFFNWVSIAYQILSFLLVGEELRNIYQLILFNFMF